jgi:hypothetical protein
MTNSRQLVDGKMIPLTHGKFSIQSEGAEAFLKNIVVRKLTGPAAEGKTALSEK